MTDRLFTKGLQEVSKDCWAYIQPDGSWGWSNAGLIADGNQSLLVDTLFDLNLTAEMLRVMRDAVPAAARIDTVVNTHANGDHFFGNQLMTGSRVLTTEITGKAMVNEELTQIPALIGRVATQHPVASKYLSEIFSPFDFSGIKVPPPTETFVGKIDLMVGAKKIKIIDAGPAHTASDLLIFVPGDKLVYTGDILFSGSHPVIWAGPVSNWLRACKMILDSGAETIVPGHGPVSNRQDVLKLIDYFEWIVFETRQRYDVGMSFEQAVFDIDIRPYEHWNESERMVPNVLALYREFSGTPLPIDQVERWGIMGRYREQQALAKAVQAGSCGGGHAGHAH